VSKLLTMGGRGGGLAGIGCDPGRPCALAGVGKVGCGGGCALAGIGCDPGGPTCGSCASGGACEGSSLGNVGDWSTSDAEWLEGIGMIPPAAILPPRALGYVDPIGPWGIPGRVNEGPFWLPSSSSRADDVESADWLAHWSEQGHRLAARSRSTGRLGFPWMMAIQQANESGALDAVFGEGGLDTNAPGYQVILDLFGNLFGGGNQWPTSFGGDSVVEGAGWIAAAMGGNWSGVPDHVQRMACELYWYVQPALAAKSEERFRLNHRDDIRGPAHMQLQAWSDQGALPDGIDIFARDQVAAMAIAPYCPDPGPRPANARVSGGAGGAGGECTLGGIPCWAVAVAAVAGLYLITQKGRRRRRRRR